MDTHRSTPPDPSRAAPSADRATSSEPAPREAVLRLDSRASNIRVARHFATRLADLLVPADRTLDSRDVQALALMVSELVSNAVEHGNGTVSVRVRPAGRRLRVEITDAGTGRPTRRYSVPGAFSGRGLEVVERLSLAWGWEPIAEGGKRVWFEY